MELSHNDTKNGEDIFDEDINVHHIKSTMPLLKLKSQKRKQEYVRTEYSITDKNSSMKSIKSLSGKGSCDRHTLRPSQVPKMIPVVTEFGAEKSASSIKK